MKCSGCYQGFSGPWCDNCDSWPCTCLSPDEYATKVGKAWLELQRRMPEGSEPRLVSFEEDGLSWECSVKMPNPINRMYVITSGYLHPDQDPGTLYPHGDQLEAIQAVVDYFSDCHGKEFHASPHRSCILR